MDDKKLLELAAKAAGLDGYEYVKATEFTYASMQRRNSGGAEDGFFELQADVWSPLTDDGDALRLAVKLKLCIDMNWLSIGSAGDTMCFMPDNQTVMQAHGRDSYAVTRRVIVRAAAEIGKQIEGND
jgi:hypothetical protein